MKIKITSQNESLGDYESVMIDTEDTFSTVIENLSYSAVIVVMMICNDNKRKAEYKYCKAEVVR